MGRAGQARETTDAAVTGSSVEKRTAGVLGVLIWGLCRVLDDLRPDSVYLRSLSPGVRQMLKSPTLLVEGLFDFFYHLPFAL